MRRVLLVGFDPATVDFSDPALPPGMVGIELRRAGCRWGVTKPALSIASWDLISTMATFSEAPL
jgi:hypothetical protein